MDRSASVLRPRVRDLLTEIHTRMQSSSPESLGAFSALGLKLGSLRANVMHALRTDSELRALAPETHPGLFELHIESNLETSLAALAAGLVASCETPAEAMLRELHEEAGLSPEPETLLAPPHLRWQVLHDVPEGRMNEATFGFILELPPKAVPVNLDGEAAGFAAFTTVELLRMIERNQLMPEAARLILEHLSHCA